MPRTAWPRERAAHVGWLAPQAPDPKAPTPAEAQLFVASPTSLVVLRVPHSAVKRDLAWRTGALKHYAGDVVLEKPTVDDDPNAPTSYTLQTPPSYLLRSDAPDAAMPRRLRDIARIVNAAADADGRHVALALVSLHGSDVDTAASSAKAAAKCDGFAAVFDVRTHAWVRVCQVSLGSGTYAHGDDAGIRSDDGWGWSALALVRMRLLSVRADGPSMRLRMP